MVVNAGCDLEEATRVNHLCRQGGSKFITCDVRGVCGYVIDDFLDEFVVEDADGDPPKEVSKARTDYDVNAQLYSFFKFDVLFTA